MRQGETFGEITFLEGGDASATITVESRKCQLYALDKATLDLMFYLNVELGMLFYSGVSLLLSVKDVSFINTWLQAR